MGQLWGNESGTDLVMRARTSSIAFVGDDISDISPGPWVRVRTCATAICVPRAPAHVLGARVLSIQHMHTIGLKPEVRICF